MSSWGSPVNNDDKKIEFALTESIASSNIVDITSDISKVFLDDIIDVGKDIPVIDIFVKTLGGIIHLRDRLYLKKVSCFLAKLGEISTTKRQ